MNKLNPSYKRKVCENPPPGREAEGHPWMHGVLASHTLYKEWNHRQGWKSPPIAA